MPSFSELLRFESLQLKIKPFFSRLKCKRCVNGIQVKPPPEDSDCNSDLSQWHHCTTKKNVDDMALKSSWEAGVTFVFHHKSHEQIQVA